MPGAKVRRRLDRVEQHDQLGVGQHAVDLAALRSRVGFFTPIIGEAATWPLSTHHWKKVSSAARRRLAATGARWATRSSRVVTSALLTWSARSVPQ